MSASGTSNHAKVDGIGKTSRHTGGSIRFDEHRINLKRKLRKEPNFLQIFLDTHLTKESKGKLWAGELDLYSLVGIAGETYEAYLTTMMEMFGLDFTDDLDMWERVQARGRPSRRIFGIGDSDLGFVMTGRPSSFCGFTPSYVEYQQSQEKGAGFGITSARSWNAT